MGNRCKQHTACSGVCRCLGAELARAAGGSALAGPVGVSVASPVFLGVLRGWHWKGSAVLSKGRASLTAPLALKSLVKERRLQPRCWWPGTGRAPLPSAEMMLQTFQLPVKQAAAFGWGFASTPLLSSSPFLCKPSLRCFSPGEAMRWGC